MAVISYLLYLLGRIVLTRSAAQALRDAGDSAITYIRKHARLDQGALCDDDYKANLWALRNDGRIFSSFVLASGEKLWVITEADRSSTCLLLPSDY